jgi:hypothetical protein
MEKNKMLFVTLICALSTSFQLLAQLNPRLNIIQGITASRQSVSTSTACPTFIPMYAQDSVGTVTGAGVYLSNGITYCSNMPFYVYPQQNSTGNNIDDIFSPCLLVDHTPYQTCVRSLATETFYENGISMGCFGPTGCVMPIGGTIAPVAGTTVTCFITNLDWSKSHDVTFSKNAGTWTTNTVTLKDCWSNNPLSSTVSTPFVWNSSTNSFTTSIPANINIGVPSYSISPSAPGAINDYVNGYALIRPGFLTPGITYTVTYHFSTSVCSNMKGTFVFTAGTPFNVSVNSPTICVGDTAVLVASGANSYTWTYGAQQNDTIRVSPNSTNNYLVTGSYTGCSNTVTDTSFVTVNQCLVWPGDADNDLSATNMDLLPLGVYFNQKGLPRAGASSNWVGQSCNDWPQIQSNGSNLKFADCNGDSTINFDDTLAINLNFGLNHPARPGASNMQTTNPDMYFAFDKSSYLTGDTVNADLYLGSSINVQTNFYGSAFEINYNAGVIVPGSEKFWFKNSWVGNINQSKIVFSKINSGTGKVYASLVKITHSDTSGFGEIARLQFVLSNTVTAAELYLSINNAIKINNGGISGPLNAGTDSVTITSGTTAITQMWNKNQIRVYPNPSNGTFSVEIPGSSSEEMISMQIIDAIGQVVYSDKIKAKSSSFQKAISFSGKNKGVYTLVIEFEKGKSVKKLVIE